MVWTGGIGDDCFVVCIGTLVVVVVVSPLVVAVPCNLLLDNGINVLDTCIKLLYSLIFKIYKPQRQQTTKY